MADSIYFTQDLTVRETGPPGLAVLSDLAAILHLTVWKGIFFEMDDFSLQKNALSFFNK